MLQAAGAVETFDGLSRRFAALVDGRHAYGPWRIVRAVDRLQTFGRYYAGKFRANANDLGDVSLFDYAHCGCTWARFG